MLGENVSATNDNTFIIYFIVCLNNQMAKSVPIKSRAKTQKFEL